MNGKLFLFFSENDTRRIHVEYIYPNKKPKDPNPRRRSAQILCREYTSIIMDGLVF